MLLPLTRTIRKPFAARRGRRRAAVTSIVASAACGTAAAQPPAAFPDPGTLDPAVPAPRAVIGHAVGAQAVRYEALVEYLIALTEASEHVALTPYARSHEGRVLYYLTITSAENHLRLDAIRRDQARLADPRGAAGAQETGRLVETQPGIAWLAYSIHGDELSSSDAALQVAYQLAAGNDEATSRLRRELVVHVDPLQNPDGRERYLAQLETLSGRVENTDYQAMQHSGLWSAGRGNHYLFDLNRDWLPQTQPETRGRSAHILDWNPLLVVDSHEMGSLDTYLFDPPREPHNVHLSPALLEWRRRFSRDQAAAFDRRGWSYYTGEWYEEWYPGYTNAWAALLGAIGLLYEQASVNAASVKQASGEIVTYRQAVEHHVVSSLANLETLRANRRELLRDYLADRHDAVAEAGEPGGTFLFPPPEDQSRLWRFHELLERQGLELDFSERPLEAAGVRDVHGAVADAHRFPAGTLVVNSAQPHRRLLHAILGFDPRMSETFLAEEREELEKRRGSRIYDVTAWSLPLAFGLEAFHAQHVTEIDADVDAAPTLPRAEILDRDPAYGWLIDGRDADVARALVILFEAGCKPRIATKPFTAEGRRYRPGAVLLRLHENPPALRAALDEIARELELDIRPADTALSEAGPDLGGRRFGLLAPPRVAVASQWPVATTSFGSVWYLADQRLRLRVSPVNVQNLGRLDLRRYNVLVLPDVWRPASLAAVLDEATTAKLRQWVEAGGTLIGIGGAAGFLAAERPQLTGVRLRRDALGELEVYAEAVQRQRDARRVEVDPDVVWGDADLPAQQETGGNGKADRDEAERKRLDEWRRLFSPRGVILEAELEPEHWLCFGLGERLPVFFSGSRAYLSRHPVRTPARLAAPDAVRLSGLLWPEARQRIADTAYATVERRGDGQVILFASDPFFRAYFEGTGRMLQNAILLGPGLGTSQPVPW